MFPPLEGRIGVLFDLINDRLERLEQGQGRILSVLAEIRLSTPAREMRKEAYSVEEVAEILGKAPYTVREWCRLGRINARKRPCGRGNCVEWEVTLEELERIRRHGLLPLPQRR